MGSVITYISIERMLYIYVVEELAIHKNSLLITMYTHL